MRPLREGGESHPGWNWGPFTFRVPLYHTRIEWPELLQGFIVAGATGLALVPILQVYFELSFEESIAVIFVHSVLISSAPIVFGEPYAPGWITPALPLVLAYLAHPDCPYQTPEGRIQFMIATTLVFSGLVFVLGITGLGSRFVEWLPPSLKGGIIMGAALAALYQVFMDPSERYLKAQPVSTIVAVSFCLLLTFSVPVQRMKSRWRWLGILAALGLLPGFLAGAVVSPVAGWFASMAGWEKGLVWRTAQEVSYSIEWGILLPPFGDLFSKVCPFAIGWPTFTMFLDGIPLALMGYVIVFGDLVTGMEVLKSATPARPDEKIDINVARSHSSIAIRNVLMGLFAPFFPTQGCLWTGVHVIIVERWKEGRKAMDSLFSGIASYYVFGVPILYLCLPVVTGLKPLMGIALSLTLVLTGFACAYVSMGIPRTQIERGVVILTGISLAVFSPWIGMLVGIISTLVLVGSMSPVPTKQDH